VFANDGGWRVAPLLVVGLEGGFMVRLMHVFGFMHAIGLMHTIGLVVRTEIVIWSMTIVEGGTHIVHLLHLWLMSHIGRFPIALIDHEPRYHRHEERAVEQSFVPIYQQGCDDEVVDEKQQ